MKKSKPALKSKKNVKTQKPHKKVKIIATVGPAVENETALIKMFKAGVDVCRLNFSFGTHAEHLKRIQMIRNAAEKTGKAVAILQDLQGPKIRIGKLTCPVEVKKGDTVILSGRTVHKETLILPTTYPKIADDTEIGKSILLADGTIRLKVTKVRKERKEVICSVKVGGTILTGKGINLPYTNISLPSLTQKDRKDAIFGARSGVDFIALSFVRSGGDVKKLRTLLEKEGVDIPIVAKIEKPEAVLNLDEIIKESDIVMVARGDLAVEISYERVPLTQKDIIDRANNYGKGAIIATQMLESMIHSPVPTRAEASDVANAIMDNAGAIMLSGETATGQYPVNAVRVMREIAEEIEPRIATKRKRLINLTLEERYTMLDNLCRSASNLSYDLGKKEKALAVFSIKGTTVRILSKYRPGSPIYAITFDKRLYNRMAMYHNVYPMMPETDSCETEAEFVEAIRQEFPKRGLASQGDLVIALIGSHYKDHWETDTIKVIRLY